MTAPTVVQDCILFAHNSKDLARGGDTNKNTNTNQHQNKKPQNKNNPKPRNKKKQKIEIDAGETVKRCELVPLNASLTCSPQ